MDKVGGHKITNTYTYIHTYTITHTKILLRRLDSGINSHLAAAFQIRPGENSSFKH